VNLKERAEYTVNNSLCVDQVLSALYPKRQTSDAKAKLPLLASTASPGREYEVGSGLWRVPVAISLRYDAKSQGAGYGDTIMARVRARLTSAQAAGTYGVIFDAELPERPEGDTIRVRTLNVTLIGG